MTTEIQVGDYIRIHPQRNLHYSCWGKVEKIENELYLETEILKLYEHEAVIFRRLGITEKNLEIANNPNSTAEDLEAIWILYSSELQVLNFKNTFFHAIAKNPNTPVKILIILGNKYLRSIDKNPALELIFLESPDFVEKIINYHGLSDSFEIKDTCKYPEWYVKKIIQYLFQLISNREHRFYLECLAGSHSTQTKYLHLLAQQKDVSIKRLVAGNPKSSESILNYLSKDDNFEVRSVVALNKNITLKLLKILSEDKSGCVRQVALRQITNMNYPAV